MNNQQLEKMKSAKGFIAALDQSGGSTPKALERYGVGSDRYSNEEEMFDLVHQMRTRIIKSKSFTGERIIGTILFKITMNSKIDGKYTADYLWEDKNIVPILKVDQGLAEEENGVQLMKDMTDLDELLAEAKERNIFGTKMRSVINEYNEEGIIEVVKQQFDYAKKIADAGFVPIIEPEVNIKSADKEKIEDFLYQELVKGLEGLDADTKVMFKLTLPTKANLYKGLYDFDNTVRVVALSGGYSREESNDLLRVNDGVVASFSRALTEGLRDDQSEDEFDQMLDESIGSIYDASVNK